MYKIEEISIVQLMEIFFASIVKVTKNSYNYYTHEVLFGGLRNREAYKITLDVNEYQKLFNLSIKNEYKAHEFYMVHIRDIVNNKIFSNKYYSKRQHYLFSDIVFIYLNKELDITYLEIYVYNKNFIKKLNSMFFISQTSWIRKINLNKKERNYLYRLNVLKAFNNGFDQFAERRHMNDIIEELEKINEEIEYQEDVFFLTGESTELDEAEEKKKELIKEWDNLTWTDKQYKAPQKKYILNKRPKKVKQKTVGQIMFDEYGMLL